MKSSDALLLIIVPMQTVGLQRVLKEIAAIVRVGVSRFPSP